MSHDHLEIEGSAVGEVIAVLGSRERMLDGWAELRMGRRRGAMCRGAT